MSVFFVFYVAALISTHDMCIYMYILWGFQHPTEATTAVGTPISVVGSARSSPKPFENDCADDEVGGQDFSQKFRRYFTETSIPLLVN